MVYYDVIFERDGHEILLIIFSVHVENTSSLKDEKILQKTLSVQEKFEDTLNV